MGMSFILLAPSYMFKPCLIVPVFRHAAQFAAFSELLPKDVPIIVVDDGSTNEDAHILDRLGFPIVRLPHNQGKMAAMLAGFKKAMTEGCTHALQIDADGQHDPDDIPRFLRAAEDRPRAIINSCPIYGENAPKSRVYGRKITNFWVRLETGNKNIKDAMCGFRVYPLAPMAPIIAKGLAYKRMGGDIEMIVKASWLGIEVIALDTKVIFPKGGVSNFSMLKDNLKLFALHTLLVLTMLKNALWRTR
jgi:glycosyltransferase involved in cell wall biosynthesis